MVTVEKYCHQTAQVTVGLNIKREPLRENGSGYLQQFSTSSNKGKRQGGQTPTPAHKVSITIRMRTTISCGQCGSPRLSCFSLWSCQRGIADIWRRYQCCSRRQHGFNLKQSFLINHENQIQLTGKSDQIKQKVILKNLASGQLTLLPEKTPALQTSKHVINFTSLDL